MSDQLKAARLSDASFGNTIDNALGDAEKALAFLLGIPLDTLITNPLFEMVAAGLKKIILQDAAGDPAAVGELLRNATLLKYHDGTDVQTLARVSEIAAFLEADSNAQGTHTVSTAAPSGTPADGSVWDRY